MGMQISPLSKKMAGFLLFLTHLDSFLYMVECVSQIEIDQHLNLGMNLLARGSYSDALTHFHAAVDADPSNYMSYYKRATVYMALSRAKPALADFDKILELKPDFLKARQQRGGLLLKMGRLNEAHIDLENVVRNEPDNGDANTLYSMITTLQDKTDDAKDAINWNNYEHAIELLTELLENIPWDPSLRELRAEAYLGLGNIPHAISDIRSVTKLTLDNTAGHFKLASLHYQLGEADESLNEVRECLKLDPDHVDCYPMYKKIKKVAKFLQSSKEASNSEDWQECIDMANKALKNEPTIENVRFHAHDRLCHCYVKLGDSLEAKRACSDAIKINNEPRLYCDRAEANLAEDMFDEAVNDYRAALEIDEDFQRAKEGIQRAQKLQKTAKKRDYYKILGVKRSASKKEINKAYKKLAMQWHPDKFQAEEDKKAAEKKFMDIAAAKEVLMDAEMRQKYDSGEDPLDPESGREGGQQFRHGGQNFHFPGGNPFGGGPFQFKFHFN
ncbi:dnaJ homolog subfamily C member 3 [Eurytemora carolleeae]|uniref:dnaJ homolog subfamily C member 3 n=1 Tax=Eurytemora carolleeae TaxID=1294199 RepID=UPI000C7637A5|nr:dnaJ homolog subfamily C member 3 [Eurytemora carolleeae]|eukprot:XP_023330976.1 dnaJ homolog subfamily C member 3-like [Eurytemora affinis]